MSYKLLNITIPTDKYIPELEDFTPEENYEILRIGVTCILEGRKAVVGLTQKEINNKIKNEYINDIVKLENDLLVQRHLTTEIETKLEKMYEIQLNKLSLQMEKLQDKNKTLIDELKKYETDNKELVDMEVNKVKDKYDLLLKEKDRQNQLNREVFDKAEKLVSKNVVKSSIAIGDDGEHAFEDLSETFKDFVGYKIEKKAHQGHKGDYHLFFKEFNVLVDLKNYTGTVQKKELDKIEQDLSINHTMDFAWLISYKTNVGDWNRFPIMYKWIMTDIGLKCIIIVNNLNSNKNPMDVLRNVWNITNELHNMLITTKETNIDNSEVQLFKERNYNVLQQMKTAQKRLIEMKRNITSMSQITKDIENDIIEMISLLSNEQIKQVYDKNSKIKEWWDLNIKFDNTSTNKLTSTEIWSIFKKHNKDFIDDNKLTVDDFKNYIKTFIDVKSYNEKSKKGSIELVGFKLIEVLVEKKTESENLVVELSIPTTIKPKKCVLKKNDTKIVINEDIDNDICEHYSTTEDDVMMISKNKNVLVWQVVSILMNHKLIKKRCDARGYEIYKNTDEYKNKVLDKN
jgi:hypothetical protein